MKIILSSLNSKFVHSNLAIRYLKTYSNMYDIELFEATINESLFDIAIKIADKNPDIIGFSCYIWNIEYTLKICSTLKEINKDLIIVLGGPEVTYDSKNILMNNSHIDYVIKGEGEITFKEFLDCTIHKKMQPCDVDGLVYRKDGVIIENKDRELIKDLDIIPFPYENDMPERMIYYEAARGCPFNCSYCLSSTIKGIRYFSIDRVKRDLKYFIDKNVTIVKFVDRTFNANKKFSMQIWDFLIKNAAETKFHFEIAADILDDEELELLATAPKELFQFEVGVQTTNKEILKNINRIMDFRKVKDNILKIKEMGNIHSHLDLIAGLPGENIESFKNSFDMCMDIIPDVLQLGFLKVLKGSPVSHEVDKYGIKYIDYPTYQVLFTKDMNFDDMQILIRLEKVFEIYYNSGIFKMSMQYILEKENSSYDLFIKLSDFLGENEFFIRGFDLREKFRLLHKFIMNNYKEDIKDILLHDFVINTKKASIPEFMKRPIDKTIKEYINKKDEFITKEIGQWDYKRVFYAPVDIKIYSEKNKFKFKKDKGVVVLNLNNGKYCYI